MFDKSLLARRPDLALLPPERIAILKRLVDRSRCNVHPLIVDRVTTSVLRIGGSFLTESNQKTPLGHAFEFISTHGSDLGWDPDVSNYELADVGQTKDDFRIVLRRVFNGMPVFGADVSLRLGHDGSVVEAVAQSGPLKIRTCPARLSERQAAIKARHATKLGPDAPILGRLTILNRNGLFGDDSPTILVWQFEVTSDDGTQYTFVDAENGDVILNYFEQTTNGDSVGNCLNPLPQYFINPATGVPSFVTFGQNGLWLPESGKMTPTETALAFFARYPLMFGTGDVPSQLRPVSESRMADPPFSTHVVLQQVYGGFPIFGCQLRIHFSPAMTITSISGNYLRDPRVVPELPGSELQAEGHAIARVLHLRRQQGVKDDPKAQLQRMGAVIWPGVLNRHTPAGNAMAWHFRFPEADLFVTARNDESGEVIAALPTQMGGDNLIYDALGAGEISNPTLVLRNGVTIGTTPSTQEARDADSFLSLYKSFFSMLGRPSLLGGTLFGGNPNDEIVTNSVFTLTPANPAHWDIVRGQAWFQPGAANLFAVGHEMTHGLSYSPGSAQFIPIDEPGALNEHFSDIIGTAVAKVPKFGFFKGSIPTTNYLRYLARVGSCTTTLGVFGSTCDFGNVHSNCGIGNMAAELIADGDGTQMRPGFGRNRMARLFADVLVHRLHPWATYLDECLNTWEAARDLVAGQVQVVDDIDPTVTQKFNGVSAEVLRAFMDVGVDPRLTAGWFTVQVGLTGGPGLITWFSGQSVDVCRLVTDVELHVRVFDPIGLSLSWWEGRSRVMGPGSGAVTFPGGVFGAAVVPGGHGVGTRSKLVTARFFHSGFLPMDVRPIIFEGPDPAPVCVGATTPVVPPEPFPTSTMAHWSFLFGDKGSDILFGFVMPNPLKFTFHSNGDRTTPPLVITDVRLDLLDRNGAILKSTSLGSPPAVIRYGWGSSLSWGASIVSDGTGTTSPTVIVRWWFDVGVACRYRLVYSFASGENPLPVLA